MIRLDRYIGNLGLISRKDIKRYMKSYRILVNGKDAISSDQKISYGDTISLGDEEIEVKEFVTVILHKPQGYVSSDVPENDYKSYRDLLLDCPYVNMLHVAGRLDQDTEGLLIASNDGKFIHDIISPKKKVPKKYLVHLESDIDNEQISLLESGVELESNFTSMPAIVERIEDKKIYLTIYEGKFHQVKRMMEVVGNKVLYLRRESIGDFVLGDLELGEWRYE